MSAIAIHATALIAEDEPLLAQALRAELKTLWPELEVLAHAGDGEAAVERALALRPQVLFLDIRMPALDGLDAAQAIVEDWPDDGRPLPLIVFVTAYDQYAMAAFERAAVDYVQKPVQPARLAQTCERLRAALRLRASAAPAVPSDAAEPLLAQLRALLGTPDAPSSTQAAPLQVIQAGSGQTLHMVPVADVLMFEAADKYVRVITAGKEHLIRTSLRELQPRLDEEAFWQVHRGTIVRATAIETAVRDEAGKLHLTLRGRPGERVVVSRLYAYRFKAM
ncbi:LytR/AlgR family response regulator transcription factor [Caldimonas sp. KR1-144]|uniref:LytR/AlgR family response regulator transcription factor n=1 Tax=Caldimonas sp. KR1-144 TaxID=3400911 RepID=UPI003C03E81B